MQCVEVIKREDALLSHFWAPRGGYQYDVTKGIRKASVIYTREDQRV